MRAKQSTVKAWQETVIIPTYPVGEEERNPMFFEKRVYQGSSGKVYPYPITEKIYDEKEDRNYNGIFLENDYLKVLILPELGGRVQMAYDKIKKRHFVYHNQVIKPALVGLLGPWISGGIEFNWPQHHRPGTFKPVDFSIQENSDGSKTVWTHEFEIMFHTRGTAGFTLYPGKAYLEIEVKLFNPTYLPQTFLWWANPAVHANDDYQSVFPPDVNAVFDHGKRDVSTFPIATGTYYKVDYSPGTNISRFRNIPVPTSYMAIHSDFDFIGGYEHDTEAGLLHVADHHVSPGKKQWTWGNGEFGKAWDRNLTDEDGPYVELMTGVYTDNQPDFSWLMPFEEKSFKQYFMPYQKVGMVKNANRDLVVGIESDGPHDATISVYTTSEQENRVEFYINQNRVFEEIINVSPEKVYQKKLAFTEIIGEKNYLLLIRDSAGKELIRYEPASIREKEIPEPAEAAKAPGQIASQIESTEKLYLTGLHLEQYRHATYSPVDYYEEALRRDPNDVRNNSALGLWYLRRGRFSKSEAFFRKSIETLTVRNPNPYVGESYFHLGVALKYQGNLADAYKAFYKATWNRAWQDASYFCLAQIGVYRKEYDRALEHINKSLDLNRNNAKAWTLKAAILRKGGQIQDALAVAEAALELDRFNLTACFENRLAKAELGEKPALETITALFRNETQTFISGALEYAHAGMFDEAINLLALARSDQGTDTHPMVHYYTGWFHQMNGDIQASREFYKKGSEAAPDYCFPNRLEAIPVLRAAIKANEFDSRAPYYLGCLYYDKQQYDLATGLWEEAARKNEQFPTVHRNLAIACFNRGGNAEKAVTQFEKAFSLNRSDARVFMELDQLYKRMNHSPEKRLQFLESHLELVNLRDDVYLERAALHNFLGDHKKAYELITQRKFHPWEGGEGRVSGQYLYSLVEMAKQDLALRQYSQAIEKLQLARTYPENLGEGKLHTARENDIHYWLGFAYDLTGDKTKAHNFWQKAAEGDDEPAAAIFYNDTPPDHIFYQGLAWRNLNEPTTADAIFRKLIAYGESRINDEVSIDYFAVSLPNMLIFEDDLNLRNRVHCLYMMGLGYLGIGRTGEAKTMLKEALNLDAMHFGAISHLRLTDRPFLSVALRMTKLDFSVQAKDAIPFEGLKIKKK